MNVQQLRARAAAIGAAAVIGMACASPALGAEIIVPDDTSLANALANAVSGDIISIRAGTYPASPGPFVIDDKKLLVRSLSGDQDVILDGQGTQRVFGVFGASASGSAFRGITFTGGIVSSGFGGAGLVAEDCSVSLTDCRFEANVADLYDGAGALEARGAARLTVVRTDFVGNSTSAGGIGPGAVELDDEETHVFRDCLFQDNTTPGGGGAALILGDGDVTFTSCTFLDNSATAPLDASGGAILAFFGARITVDACVFEGNTSAYVGGAISAGLSWVVVRNSVFRQNTTEEFGVVLCLNGILEMVNCTLVQNSNPTGPIVSADSDSCTVGNSIFWSNGPTNIEMSPNAIVGYNIIDGGYDAPEDENLDVDPMFVDFAGGDLRLAEGSPAIDRGSSNHAAGPFVDLDGNPRAVDDPGAPNHGEAIIGPPIDIGAYERQDDTPVCPADVDGNGAVDFADLLQVLATWGPCP